MYKKITIVFITALTFRILFFLLEAPWDNQILEEKVLKLGTDQRGYHQLAINFIKYQKFVFKEGLPEDALRTPAYPLFISSIYFLFGQYPWVVILFQVLIDVFSAVILFLIIRNLFNDKIAFIGGMFYAIDPHLILHSNTFYSETLLSFILIFFLFFISKFFLVDKKKSYYAMLSGLSLGFAALVKPAIAYLPYILFLFFLFNFRQDIRKALLYSCTFLIFYFIAVSPWLIRNKIVFGDFFLSNSGEYNLLAINITPMEIPKRKLPQHIVEAQLRAEADSLMYSENVVPLFNKEPTDYWEGLAARLDYKKTEYWKRVAFNYIKKEPLTFAKYYLLGIVHTFFNLGTKEFAYYLNFTEHPSSLNLKEEPSFLKIISKFFTEKPLVEIILGFLILLYLIISYLFGIKGIYEIKFSDHKNFLFLCLIISAYFISVAGAGGLARFKLPAIPFYIIFISIGLNSFLINKMKFSGLTKNSIK